MVDGLFGLPPPGLLELPPGAAQFSPLMPGACALGAVAPGGLRSMAMYAVPGTLERRHDLASMVRALAPDAPFAVAAPKGAGGARLLAELEGFGCAVAETSRRHHRICSGLRPRTPVGLDAAVAAGAPRFVDDLGLWSQPGLFSWDRLDPGSELLLAALPALAGDGADLGCGLGVLAHGVLAAAAVRTLHLVDIDRRAIEAARRNVGDERARFHWADIRVATPAANLDFVVTNPPFHEAGKEDKGLGAAVLQRSAAMLRSGGELWLVANRHLPYEQVLNRHFRAVTPRLEGRGFKVLSARK